MERNLARDFPWNQYRHSDFWWKKKRLTWPLCDYEKSQRFWITGYWYSDIPYGISSRDGERFPILRKAIRAVTNSEVRGLMKVIEELRVENTPLSTSIADHIESFTDYDFAHLLFSNGYVEQSISLEKQLNIIQVADLVLPDKENFLWGIYHYGLLSVAMLIVISTFALDFIHTDRSIFKIVDLDEAWSFFYR